MFYTWSSCDSFGKYLISAEPLLRAGTLEVRREEALVGARFGELVSRRLVVVDGEGGQEMPSHACATG